MQLLLQTGRRLLTVVFTLLLLSSLSLAQDISDLAKAAKVTPDLLKVLTNQNAAPTAPINGFEVKTRYEFSGNSVAIEAVATDGNGGALLQQLQGLGLQNARSYRGIVSGYLPIDQIANLKNIANLAFASPYYKPIHNTGSVTSQGDHALKADVARATYNATGAGSKVGVISDSYNKLGGAAAGVASNDLPAGVQVLQDDMGANNNDEGRAMAEIVHDVAPGAAIAFHTANGGQANFAQGIKDLASAGCNIIVDDVEYFAEPFFQDGIIAQAVDEVVSTSNVAYFSAAGNQARSSYQHTYVPNSTTIAYGTKTGTPHVFSGTDFKQSITIPAHGEIFLIFQWDNPFFSVSGAPGAQTDMDLLVFVGGAYQASLSSLGNNTGGDPIEFIDLVNNGNSSGTLEVVLVKRSGPDPNFIKYVNFGDNLTIEYDTKSGASYGHNNSNLGIGVGAAPYYNTPASNTALTTAIIEPFSSAGGTPIFLNPNGTRINGNTGIMRQQPLITSVDGGNTTFFFPGDDPDSDGFPNFFGTSAAAPHAAAVAALLREKSGNSISPATVGTILKNTALDMDDPSTAGFDAGFDYGTGYGFIQADRALGVICSLSITQQPSSGTAVCAGANVTASVSVTSANGTPTYQWYKDGTSLGAAQQSATLSLTNVTTANSGSYSVVVTGNCNSLTSSTFSLTVNPAPTAGLVSSGTLTCTNNVTLTASGGVSYTFSAGATQIGNTNQAVVTQGGTYTVTVANASGCKSTTTTTVSSNTSAPTAGLVSSGTLTCTNTSVTLTASGGVSYTFSAGASQIGSSNQAIVTQGGTYTVTVTNASGCTAAATTTVSSNTAAPTASLTNNGPLSATMTTVTLTAGGGTSYAFSAGASQPGGPTSNTASVTLAGTYSVVVTGANGCTASAQTTVTNSQASPTSQTVCRSSNAVISVVVSGSGLSYQWYKNGQTAANKMTEIASIQKGTTTNSLTLVNNQTSANYYLKVTDGGGVVTWYGPYQVSVNANCNNRLGAEEPVAVLSVEVLVKPNPLTDSWLRAVVKGAGGQPLQLQLKDLSGRSVHTQSWEQAGEEQGVEWDLSSHGSGVYLLQAVSTPAGGAAKAVTLKIVKP